MLRRLLVAILPILAGCETPVIPVSVEDVRGHLSSPKPRYYIFQTIGPGHELADEERAEWLPVAGPAPAKRIVIRFGEDERLEYAAVLSAGADGEFNRTDEVLFDRSLWLQR